MNAAEKILGRLNRVKAVGHDKWAAGCPVCQSRNGRPIAIRAMPDGRVLLHAFCCCETADVLGAIGLRLSDLFPDRLGDFKPERRPFDALQVLHAVSFEMMVVELIASDLATRSDALNDAEQQRLYLASQRLTNALSMVGEAPVPPEIKRLRQAAA